jgi:hypothetical protein
MAIFNQETVDALIARNVVKRSIFGRSGVFRLGDDGGFISNLTGKSFSTISEVYEEMQSMSAVGFASIHGQSSMANPYANVSHILRNINRQTGSADPKSSLGKFLMEELGLQPGTQSILSANIIEINDEQGGMKHTARKLLRQLEAGNLKGIPLVDDEGGRIVEFIFGRSTSDPVESGIKLTESQIYKLLSLSDSSLIDFTSLQDISSANDLLKMLSKLPKRLKGFTSPRDLVIDEDMFSRMFKGSSIEEKMFGIDLKYDLLFGKLEGWSNISGKELRSIYGVNLPHSGYRKLADDIFDRFLTSSIPGDTFRADFEDLLRQSMSGMGGPERVADFRNLRSKTLKENFESLVENIVSEGERARYKDAFSGILDAIEKSDDGSIMLNNTFLRKVHKQISGEITSLRNQIQLGPENVESLKEELSSLVKLQSRIGKEDLESLTVRGSAFGYSIKSAATFADFTSALSGYVGVITEMSLKKEAGINKSANLIFSGFGRASGEVFTDAVGAAFNPEVYASPEALEGYKKSIQARISMLESALETGIIPDELRQSIERTAEFIDDEFLPEFRGPSSIRNRQFMEELSTLINSGVSPKHHPKLANMLHKYVMSQAIREKNDLYQVIMDDSFRFAVNTEEKLSSVTGKTSLFMDENRMPKYTETVSLRGTGAQAQDVELTKFRVKGHTMYVPGLSVTELFDTLGGFDLDDKGIPRMVFTGSGGERKLAFYTLRQPQGVQEYVLMSMNYDSETIKSVFSGDNNFGRNFRSTLESMVQSDPSQHRTELHSLLRNMNVESKVGTVSPQSNQSYIEAVNAVIDEMSGRGLISVQNLDSPSLASLADEVIRTKGGPLINVEGKEAAFTRLGLLRMQAEGANTATDVAKEKFLEIIKELSEEQNYSDSIRSIIQQNSDDLDQLLRATKNLPELLPLWNNAFGRMQLIATAENSNVLGAYINTSMIVGSTRRQLEAISELDPTIARLITENPILLPGQEFAIDLSKTLNIGGVKLDIQQIIAKAQHDLMSSQIPIAVSEENIKNYLSKMGLDEDTLGQIDLQKFSQYQRRALGAQMAYATSAYYGRPGIDEDLFPGIDRKIAERVFTPKSTVMDDFLNQYMETLTSEIDRVAQLGEQDRANQLQARYERLSNIRQMSEADKAMAELIDEFSLRKGSKFASVESIHDVALGGANEFRYLLRSNLIRSDDPTLSFMASQIDESSYKTARFLLDKNMDLITSLYTDAEKLSENLAIDERFAARLQFNLEFQQQMYAASGGDESSFRNLVNALDIEIAQRQLRFDIAGDYLVDETGLTENFSKKIFDKVYETRAARSKLFYQQTASLLSKDLTTLLSGTGEADIQQAAKALLGSPDIQTGEVARKVLETIVGINQTNIVNVESKNIVLNNVAEEVAYVRSLFEERAISSGALPPPLPSLMPEVDIPDEIRSIYDDVATSSPISTETPYKRFDFDTLRNIFSDNTVKKTSLLLGALVVGSFMYQSSKDKTVDDMSGPPLLPGGSAYEMGFPKRMPHIGSYAPENITPTMSYNISLSGSYQQVQDLNRSLGNMDIGRINTTMYNSLPNLRRDIYSEFGSSF